MNTGLKESFTKALLFGKGIFFTEIMNSLPPFPINNEHNFYYFYLHYLNPSVGAEEGFDT